MGDQYAGRPNSLGHLPVNLAADKSAMALVDIDRFYRDLVEQMNDLVQSVAPDGRILFVNRAWRETLGYTEAEAGALNLFEVIHPDSRAHCMAVMQRLMAGEKVDAIEFSLRARDGREINVKGQVNVHSENGSPVATRGIFRDISEGKRTQEALRVSAERLNLALSSSRLALWDWDLRSGMVYLSKEWAGIAELDADQALTIPAVDLQSIVHPDDGNVLLKQLGQTLKGERNFYSVDHRIKAGTGRWKWIRSHGMVVERDAMGKAVRMTGTNADIDMRMNAEQELRAALLQEEAILSTSPVGIFLARDRAIMKCNRTMEQLFGYGPGEMLGLPTKAICASEEQWAWIGGEGYRIMREGMLRFEIEYLRKDGSRFWALLHGAQVDRGDEDSGRLFTVTDISVQKHTQETLAAAEQRLRDMTNGLPGAVYQIRWGTDGKARILFISEGIVELIGVERSAIEADPELAFKAIAEEDREQYLASLKLAAENKARKWTHESRVRRPDGTVAWTRSDASRQGHGPDAVWNGYWVDISAQREYEDKLNQARIEADSANRAKSAFLATMSHEIRTPMNAVLGMLELLGLSSLDASQGEMLGVAGDSAKSLLRIIEDILDVSKIEAGQMSIRTEPSSLDSVLDSAMKALAGAARQKGLVLSRQVDPALAAKLMFDPARLSQVLFNLIGNAIKFTEKGQVQIRATLLQNMTKSQLIRIDVQDSGIGIRPEDQQRLFQAFVQAEADTTRRFGGTGLGLVISRRLIELMGGTLTLVSEPGRGTTMTATLELFVTEKAAPAVITLPVGATVPRSECLRVLVAEDNEVNQILLRRQIETLGFQADFAADGEQALKLWRSGNYAVVLCDCQMPVMDGYSFARAVRAVEAQEPARGKVPILACTANAMKEDAEACYAAGMDDVVSKPVNLAVLKQKLAAWGLVAGS
jgi:PAS domain S-box-containing protein